VDNLQINIKKVSGALEIKLTAQKMATRPQKVVERIRIKTAAVKRILEEKGYKPGMCIHADNSGCLDNSPSCAQFNLKTTWVFEDLNAKTPKKETEKAILPNQTKNPLGKKVKNSKGKVQ